jgi:hypothetical protein
MQLQEGKQVLEVGVSSDDGSASELDQQWQEAQRLLKGQQEKGLAEEKRRLEQVEQQQKEQQVGQTEIQGSGSAVADRGTVRSSAHVQANPVPTSGTSNLLVFKISMDRHHHLIETHAPASAACTEAGGASDNAVHQSTAGLPRWTAVPKRASSQSCS